MDTKKLRHKKIIEVIERRPMATQEELVNELSQLGMSVSQSTLSKDIKQLGLVKARNVDGTAQYSPPMERAAPQDLRILQRELQDYLLRYDNAQNLLVLVTMPGNAQGVCSAIDGMKWPEILGSVAGDDTIIVVSRTVKDTKAIMARIKEISGV